MKRLLSSFLLSVHTALSFAQTPDNLQQADTVELQYGWYPDISIAVEYHKTELIKKSGGEKDTFNVDGNYLIRTKTHPDGLQIDFEPIYFIFNKSGHADADNKLQEFMQRLTGINPSYVINTEGSFHEIIKFDEFSKAIKNEMSDFFKDIPEQQFTKIQQLVNTAFSREQIMSQLQDEWNRDVGQWAGGKLERGYTYDIKFNRPIPILDNLQVPGIGHYEYTGRTPCNHIDKNNSCVRLNYYSQINEEATKPIMQELFKKMGIKDKKDFSFKVDYNLEVITEEKTLFPHYVKETTSTLLPNTAQDNLLEKKVTKEFNYTYIKRQD